MKLWRDIDFRVQIADIETLKGCIALGFKNPDNGITRTFEISPFKNDIYSFVKFYSKDNIDFVCGFNFVKFDAQVIQFIIENYENWHEKTNIETCHIIYQFTQDLIDDQNYNLRLPFYENRFSLDVIDVFSINGLDNEARRTSLKAAAFQTDGQVEEMPIHHSREDLTQEEIADIISYMYNDINETERLLQITIGNTKIKGYENNNQLELRKNIEEEFKLKCLNYSEIKIGEELLKLKYAEAIGKQIKDLPRKGTFRKEIRLKNCLPKYVEFQTKQLKELLKLTKSTIVSMSDTFENKFKFYNTEYVQGLGGLHSVNNSETWEANEEFLIEDDDVASYYPAIVVNNGFYPYHLGKELLNVYKQIYLKRLELKPLAKKDKRIKGIVEAFKLILNSCFGKFGSMESWLFDKQTLYSVTLTGQFSIFMLIEMFELEGIRVISANSDGVTTYFHKDKLDKKKEIVKKWQEITQYEVETVSFKKFIYSTVNDYIAIKSDGEVKTKGDFDENVLLYKNKSRNIVPLALKEYYTKNVLPEDFIPIHKNIYDFCIRQKSSKDFHYEGVSKDNTTIYNKLIRYYVSIKGEKILKIKNASCDTNAVQAAQAEAGDYLMTVCNFLDGKTIPQEAGIDYQYYIDKAYTIINKIKLKGKKQKLATTDKQQLSMF